MNNDIYEEPEQIGYLWSNVPRSEENYLADVQHITQKTVWKKLEEGKRHSCGAALFFDKRDKHIFDARLVILINDPVGHDGIAYDGAFADKVMLFYPKVREGQYLNISAHAFVDEERISTYWSSLNVYDLYCDERPLSLHLLNYNHMDYSGSTLVVLREDKVL